MSAAMRLMVLALLALCSQVAAAGFTVSVFSTTSKTVILRWSRFPGATSYKITAAARRLPDSPVAFVTYGPNTVMGSVSSLSTNVEYVFTVDALDDSQETLSSTSTESSTAPDTMDPIHTVKPKDSRTLMVDFNTSPTATHYILRVRDASGLFREDAVSSSPAEIQSLSPYTEYTLSVLAVNSAGRSQPSTPVTAKTVLPPPELSTSSPSNDSLVVSWPAVAHAVRYTLSLYKVDSNTKMVHNTSDTNLTISGLEAGTLYTVTGYAWDPEGREGEGSVYMNQTTRPPTPSSVNVSLERTGGVASLIVTWGMDPVVYGHVEFSVTSDQNRTCTAVSSSSCRLSPVHCGDVHTIQVTASNQAGPGAPSCPVVFITFPCPPESLALVKSWEQNCTLTWDATPHADSYVAFVKAGDGSEESCNTTGSACSYGCRCGYTYLMSVLAFNMAGSSPPGAVLNHTTLPCCPEDVSVSSVSADTLEIRWAASRGAELYETSAAHMSEVVLCNDTAPACVLSDLTCDSAYSVKVTPCNEISGCNRACDAHAKDTAPCTPTDLMLSVRNSSLLSVSWTPTNRAATYTVTADGGGAKHAYTTRGGSVELADLPCGSTYEVSVTASTAAGVSLPSYSESVETEPCCPANLTVRQVTQAMTNVSWSDARGAHTFVASLTSSRGHARCRTGDSHCLMGCITCGTSYTVAMETFSRSGLASNCTYRGFSSSACCPSGVRLVRTSDDSLRVQWRGAGRGHRTTADLLGGSSNYTCTAPPGGSRCGVGAVRCGAVYHVAVAPLAADGGKVQHCPQRMYSVTCSGSDIGTVIYRGKRSVD